MIHQYNKHVDGVGLCDMLMWPYHIELGFKKWYSYIVYYCNGVAVTNIWVLYKRHCTQNGIYLIFKKELQIPRCIKKNATYFLIPTSNENNFIYSSLKNQRVSDDGAYHYEL